MTDNGNFITLTEMADGFSEHNLKQTGDLVDKMITVYAENGQVIQYQFKDMHNLSYEIIEGEHKGLGESVTYIATQPRKGYFYLGYVDQFNHFISVVLDFKKNIASLISGEFPTDKTDTLPIFKRVMHDLPPHASKITCLHASLDTPFNDQTEKHEPSTDLVGQMVSYSYSEKDAYLHIYHPNNLFTWACFSGNEAGLADTDYATFLKLDDDLYVIIWIEKVLHVISTILLDFKQMRSSGAMASYAGKDYASDILMVPSGAVIEKIKAPNLTDLKPAKLS
ncbi:MoaF C-terminal domain-containing protein [Lactococcus carnosus]|uniref:Molybdenum cofactor biosynthesis protein F n=1 Tax=Pseudolactococcus carnosus TaxID=2749961 RepID=A0ABT0AVE8_9LACT|nr:MoaF C-terminal domain-containing protein [Lactococcus carnosus]MCJ1990545.1 hypothetical protein [Lactococcus carnosus]